MFRPDHDIFYSDVYNIVAQIPFGKVLTYGDIARLAGWQNHSRMVGRALRYCPEELRLPCHRVVNANGGTAPDWHNQADLLKAEGVCFKKNGCVYLNKSRWLAVLD